MDLMEELDLSLLGSVPNSEGVSHDQASDEVSHDQASDSVMIVEDEQLHDRPKDAENYSVICISDDELMEDANTTEAHRQENGEVTAVQISEDCENAVIQESDESKSEYPDADISSLSFFDTLDNHESTDDVCEDRQEVETKSGEAKDGVSSGSPAKRAKLVQDKLNDTGKDCLLNDFIVDYPDTLGNESLLDMTSMFSSNICDDSLSDNLKNYSCNAIKDCGDVAGENMDVSDEDSSNQTIVCDESSMNKGDTLAFGDGAVPAFELDAAIFAIITGVYVMIISILGIHKYIADSLSVNMEHAVEKLLDNCPEEFSGGIRRVISIDDESDCIAGESSEPNDTHNVMDRLSVPCETRMESTMDKAGEQIGEVKDETSKEDAVNRMSALVVIPTNYEDGQVKENSPEAEGETLHEMNGETVMSKEGQAYVNEPLDTEDSGALIRPLPEPNKAPTAVANKECKSTSTVQFNDQGKLPPENVVGLDAQMQDLDVACEGEGSLPKLHLYDDDCQISVEEKLDMPTVESSVLKDSAHCEVQIAPELSDKVAHSNDVMAERNLETVNSSEVMPCQENEKSASDFIQPNSNGKVVDAPEDGLLCSLRTESTASPAGDKITKIDNARPSTECTETVENHQVAKVSSENVPSNRLFNYVTDLAEGISDSKVDGEVGVKTDQIHPDLNTGMGSPDRETDTTSKYSEDDLKSAVVGPEVDLVTRVETDVNHLATVGKCEEHSLEVSRGLQLHHFDNNDAIRVVACPVSRTQLMKVTNEDNRLIFQDDAAESGMVENETECNSGSTDSRDLVKMTDARLEAGVKVAAETIREDFKLTEECISDRMSMDSGNATEGHDIPFESEKDLENQVLDIKRKISGIVSHDAIRRRTSIGCDWSQKAWKSLQMLSSKNPASFCHSLTLESGFVLENITVNSQERKCFVEEGLSRKHKLLSDRFAAFNSESSDESDFLSSEESESEEKRRYSIDKLLCTESLWNENVTNIEERNKSPDVAAVDANDTDYCVQPKFLKPDNISIIVTPTRKKNGNSPGNSPMISVSGLKMRIRVSATSDSTENEVYGNWKDRKKEKKRKKRKKRNSRDNGENETPEKPEKKRKKKKCEESQKQVKIQDEPKMTESKISKESNEISVSSKIENVEDKQKGVVSSMASPTKKVRLSSHHNPKPSQQKAKQVKKTVKPVKGIEARKPTDILGSILSSTNHFFGGMNSSHLKEEDTECKKSAASGRSSSIPPPLVSAASVGYNASRPALLPTPVLRPNPPKWTATRVSPSVVRPMTHFPFPMQPFYLPRGMVVPPLMSVPVLPPPPHPPPTSDQRAGNDRNVKANVVPPLMSVPLLPTPPPPPPAPPAPPAPPTSDHRAGKDRNEEADTQDDGLNRSEDIHDPVPMDIDDSTNSSFHIEDGGGDTKSVNTMLDSAGGESKHLADMINKIQSLATEGLEVSETDKEALQRVFNMVNKKLGSAMPEPLTLKSETTNDLVINDSKPDQMQRGPNHKEEVNGAQTLSEKLVKNASCKATKLPVEKSTLTKASREKIPNENCKNKVKPKDKKTAEKNEKKKNRNALGPKPKTDKAFHGRTLLWGQGVHARVVPLEPLYLTKPYTSFGEPQPVPKDPRLPSCLKKQKAFEEMPVLERIEAEERKSELNVLLYNLHEVSHTSQASKQISKEEHPKEATKTEEEESPIVADEPGLDAKVKPDSSRHASGTNGSVIDYEDSSNLTENGRESQPGKESRSKIYKTANPKKLPTEVPAKKLSLMELSDSSDGIMIESNLPSFLASMLTDSPVIASSPDQGSSDLANVKIAKGKAEHKATKTEHKREHRDSKHKKSSSSDLPLPSESNSSKLSHEDYLPQYTENSLDERLQLDTDAVQGLLKSAEKPKLLKKLANFQKNQEERYEQLCFGDDSQSERVVTRVVKDLPKQYDRKPRSRSRSKRSPSSHERRQKHDGSRRHERSSSSAWNEDADYNPEILVVGDDDSSSSWRDKVTFGKEYPDRQGQRPRASVWNRLGDMVDESERASGVQSSSSSRDSFDKGRHSGDRRPGRSDSYNTYKPRDYSEEIRDYSSYNRGSSRPNECNYGYAEEAVDYTWQYRKKR